MQQVKCDSAGAARVPGQQLCQTLLFRPCRSSLPCLMWLPVCTPACRMTALSLEASTYSELRASLEAAHNRSAELSQASVAAVHYRAGKGVGCGMEGHEWARKSHWPEPAPQHASHAQYCTSCLTVAHPVVHPVVCRRWHAAAGCCRWRSSRGPSCAPSAMS